MISLTKHHSSKMKKEDWLTPPYIINALGPFDLDPCASIDRPWDTATEHYTKIDDGLLLPWDGVVWCNPPYGNKTSKWLDKMAKHNNGIALTFARTETKNFLNNVWLAAKAVLFITNRLTFHDKEGKKAIYNAGAPSVLIAYGYDCSMRLHNSKIEGIYINQWTKL